MIGTLTPEMFHVLRYVCKPLWEAFKYNFAEELINSVCDGVSLFSDMSEKDRSTLATKIDVVAFTPGESVYKHGSKGRCFYVLVQGAVEELFEETNQDTGVVTCQPGYASVFCWSCVYEGVNVCVMCATGRCICRGSSLGSRR